MDKKTPLYDKHVALGAKIVPFAGWEMPVQYKGILIEHKAVREKVGLFDVSHMGRIDITGPDAGKFLDSLSTNQIVGKAPLTATYTVLCHPDGGSVDDTIVYAIDDTHYFIIANAGNREKDLHHLQEKANLQKMDVEIKDRFSQTGILALQGPQALPLLTSLLPEVASLKPMHFLVFEKGDFIISRTGYTGAGGFEFYGSAEKIIEWWEDLLEKGKSFGIEPVGLGARDTLRLEMGFALYGHELTDAIAPIESVAAWTVKWEKENFLGKEALLKMEKEGMKRFAYPIALLEKGIPRQGYPVLKEGVTIGEITSGSFSPTLEKGIALILVNSPLKIGDCIQIQIRQNLSNAEVVKLPFISK